MEEEIPITDNHMHVNPSGGKGPREVARTFARSGGTHIMVVNKLLEEGNTKLGCRRDFVRALDGFLECVEMMNDAGVRAYGVVGPHPVQLVKLWEPLGGDRAVELMVEALELSAGLVREGRAVALGEIGRPHFQVSQEVWEASNDLMAHAFDLAADLGCAVQLHTETGDRSQFEEISGIARKSGLSPEKVVKHHSPPLEAAGRETGLMPSILARKDEMGRALREGSRFLMETDFMDDPRRPGAVLGPRTVPRVTRRMIRDGDMDPEAAWAIHATNVERTYGIEVSL